MAARVNKKRLEAFLQRLSNLLDGRLGAVFLLGGSALTWLDVKKDSFDVDLSIVKDDDPVPLMEAIQGASDFIEANADVIEMGELLPLPEGYAERSRFLSSYGSLSVHCFDLYSIALTKLHRFAAKDTDDVGRMLKAGLIECDALGKHFESVMEQYKKRVTRGDWEDFKRKFESFYRQHCE